MSDDHKTRGCLALTEVSRGKRMYPMHTEYQAQHSLMLAKWDFKHGGIDVATFQKIKQRITERYPSLGDAAT